MSEHCSTKKAALLNFLFWHGNNTGLYDKIKQELQRSGVSTGIL